MQPPISASLSGIAIPPRFTLSNTRGASIHRTLLQLAVRFTLARLLPITAEPGIAAGSEGESVRRDITSLMRSPGRCVGIACGLFLLATAASAQPQYMITDLGSLGGGQSGSGANICNINNAGQVVGISTLPSGAKHGFRTAPNQPINPQTDDLGTSVVKPVSRWASIPQGR